MSRRRWAGGVGLVLLGMTATSNGLSNQFTQDDLPLIFRNGSVQTLHSPTRFFTQPYWRAPFPSALYRPLATTAHALQWATGDGDPRVFRWVSAALLIGAGLAVYRLALLILPPAAAWVSAALFLVHPVHVEATALAVNQGELAVGLLLALGAALYIRDRARGMVTPRTTVLLVFIYVAAMLFKEHALILPALLVAAELTVIRDARSLTQRLVSLRPLYLRLALAAALFLAVRTLVLGGDSIGTPVAEALAGSGAGGRALTMLDVTRHWTRLLLWPAELQADYGPNEIVAATGWHFAQSIGFLLLGLWTAAVVWSWRRLPALAFVLLWTAAALAPVSNVLVPTGIVLAERTLFLASAGVTIGLATLFSLAWERGSSPRLRAVAGVAVAILLGLGIMRSASRSRVWHNQETLLRQTVSDAPRSASAHLAFARLLDASESAALSEAHFRKAAILKPVLVDQELVLADQYRLAGLCRPAVRHYRLPLLVRPGDPSIRASLVACLLDQQRYDDVRIVARPGLSEDSVSPFFRRAIRTADSALTAGSDRPPGQRDSTSRPSRP